MFRRTPLRWVALIVPILLSGSQVALAQGYGYGGSGYGGYSRYGRAYVGGFGTRGFFDTGIGAFGGGRPPGSAFGFDPRYLASRAFTAGGTIGGLTFGWPQTPEPEAPRSDALARAATSASTAMTPTSASQPATSAPTPAPATSGAAPESKVLNGETAFRNGDYPAAIDDWKNAITDGSRNPVLVLLLGQAYFAAGEYQEAATATQAAMHALPEDRWGLVVSNRKELYTKPSSYIFQLRQLEDAVNDKPNDPAQRFLLGYHYAYLGYPTAAVAQLDKVIELEPRDRMAAQLRQTLASALPDPAAPVITPNGVTGGRR